MKIILADDNEKFLEGLRFFLRKSKNMEIIAEVKNGFELLNNENLRFADLVLIDLEMPQVGGKEATRKALWLYPHIRFIAITMHTDKAYLKTLVEAGFKGCVFKDELYTDLPSAIYDVMHGKYHFPSDIPVQED
mgnify:CR=1 FL=1